MADIKGCRLQTKSHSDELLKQVDEYFKKYSRSRIPTPSNVAELSDLGNLKGSCLQTKSQSDEILKEVKKYFERYPRLRIDTEDSDEIIQKLQDKLDYLRRITNIHEDKENQNEDKDKL